MNQTKLALPDSWTTVTIEELFAPLEDRRTLHQGWSPQCEKEPSESENVWGVLKTTAIQAGQFLPEHNKRLPDHLQPRPLIEVHSGDILITCAGPRARCGVACLVRQTRPKLMMSGKMYRFRVPEGIIEPRFIEAYLQTQAAQVEIDKMKTGGSDSGLNLTHDRFRPLRVPVAPFNEQTRIADKLDELFSDLDAGVEALKRVREKLKLYRASVLKAAVEGKLTEEWRRQNPDVEPASELLKRILAERRKRWEEDLLRKFEVAGKKPPKDWQAKYKEPISPDISKLPGLPDGWCWTSLDQMTALITKGTSPGWQGFEYQTTGIPFVRSQNVRWGGLDLSNLEYLPPQFNDSHSGSIIHTGDVLLNLVGASIGRCAIATQQIHGANLNQAVGIIRLVQPEIVNRWVAVYVISSHGQRHIHTTKADVARANFNLDDIRPMPLPLPSLDEQAAIVKAIEERSSILEHIEEDLEGRLLTSQCLRQSMLQSAFTGRLVEQDPGDESASELLKRISASKEVLENPVSNTESRRRGTGMRPSRHTITRRRIRR